MPIPSNITALTAIEITDLPYSNTQTVDNAGTTYDVWYAYTAQAGDVVLSIFGYGDASVYTPEVLPFTGPASAPTAYLIDGTASGNNKPVQIPVTPGTLYLFKFRTNAGNPSPAPLAVEIESFAQADAPVGSIAVNDDTDGFPLVLLDAATGDPIRMIAAFVNGEGADTFEDGKILAEDETAQELVLYGTDYEEITRIPLTNEVSIRTNRATNTAWVGVSGGAARLAFPVTSIGGVGAVETMTGVTNIEAFCASPDDTILYCAADVANAPVQRWDVTNNVLLSNLVAGIANYIPRDALGLPDGDILVGYSRTATGDFFVKRYDDAGNTVTTYSIGTTTFPGGTLPRLAYATNHPASFWTWHHNDGVSTFTNVNTETAAVIDSVTTIEYEAGVYQPTASATPDALYGVSFSCPFWITRSASGPTPITPPDGSLNGPAGLTYLRSIGVLRDVPVVRLRRFPHIADSPMQRIKHNRLRIDVEVGVGTSSGQGVSPTLRMCWSDNAAATWSNGRSMSTGRQGDYSFLCESYQLGMARVRTYEITQSDPVKTVWLGADLDLTEGLS